MGFIICMGFTAALRGEEIMLADLSGLSGYLEDALNYKVPFVPLTLRGRFKGEMGLRSHMLPLATTTNSGIQVELWDKRMLQWRLMEGRSTGYIFQQAGSRMKIGDFSDNFHTLLENVQRQYPTLIDDRVNI